MQKKITIERNFKIQLFISIISRFIQKTDTEIGIKKERNLFFSATLFDKYLFVNDNKCVRCGFLLKKYEY